MYLVTWKEKHTRRIRAGKEVEYVLRKYKLWQYQDKANRHWRELQKKESVVSANVLLCTSVVNFAG